MKVKALKSLNFSHHYPDELNQMLARKKNKRIFFMFFSKTKEWHNFKEWLHLIQLDI